MKTFYTKELAENPLEHTGYSAAEVFEKLHENSPDFRKALGTRSISSVKVDQVNEGQGFASKIFQISIEFDHESTSPFVCIMKIPSYDMIEAVNQKLSNNEKQPSDGYYVNNMTNMHNNECEFYAIFREVKVLPLPKIYYLSKVDVEKKQRGMILMEHLGNESVVLNIFTSLNEEQIKNVVCHIAKFHAYLWSHVDQWHGHFKRNAFVDEESTILTKQMIQQSIAIRPDMYTDVAKKFGELLFDPNFSTFCLEDCCEKIGIPKVLCHGDMWISNIFWHKNSEGSASNVVRAIIDAQLAFEGNPSADIARLLVISSGADLRHKLEQEIIDHYYDVLQHETSKLNYKVSFTKEQLKEAYDYAMVNQAIFLLMMTAFLTGAAPKEEPALTYFKMGMEKIVVQTRDSLYDAWKICEQFNGKYGF